MTRTIGRHAPKYLAPDEVVETCDYCGTPWLKSKLRKDRSGLWYCPNEGEGRDKTALNQANARALQRGLRPQKAVSGRKPVYRPQLLDNISVAPVAAWSVSHRLRSAYASDLIKIRVGTTETNITYGDYDALDTAAIVTVAGSSAAYVTTVYDQSGNGRNLTQAITASQPRIYSGTAIDTMPMARDTLRLEDKPALVFDGVDDYMNHDTMMGLSGNTALTVFGVFKLGEGSVTAFDPASLFEIGTHPDPETATADSFIVGQSAGSDGLVYLFILRNGYVSGDTFIFYESAMRKMDPQVLIVRYPENGRLSQARMTKNGAQLTNVYGPVSDVQLNLNSGLVRVGWDGEVGPDYYDMRLSTLCVWDEELSNEDVATLNTFAFQEYGLARLAA